MSSLFSKHQQEDIQVVHFGSMLMYYLFKTGVIATNTPLKIPKVSELLLGSSYAPWGPWFGGCTDAAVNTAV